MLAACEMEDMHLNISQRQIDLYINGQVLSLELRYDNDADIIIETWKKYKFGDFEMEVNDDEGEDNKDEGPSYSELVFFANGLLEISHANGTLHVDINSLNAINRKYS